MDVPDLMPLLEQLDDNVDDLEEVLQPILGQSLAKVSKNLPVMDKAKIHVLATYTLESLIFSYLRLKGVDAKQHPVFRELTRVRQYFEKIKEMEKGPEERPMTLDKAAAGRFIKAGLAGNDKIDLERAEREAKERARAEVKAAILARKAKAAAQATADTSSAAPSSAPDTANSDDDSDEEMQDKAEAGSESGSKASTPTSNSKKLKKLKKETGISGRKAANRAAKQERRQKKEDARKARGAK
ncbi:hypothetical protein N7532_001446 [Penicillium argentinense]|uniref:Exosome complex protein n=1 Tax=Penicillium argentinense TaxID=1131581 RepID=A0A9W9KMG0_9EURO|nr:uncharacterized protein N7532_001446 [Penicillium argentinense]KAJ5110911.1 hypothetical protein N7532_001446 [Penicillium argentinense]